MLGSGNSSSQTIQVNDYLYTNSGATSPLASGNYGIGSSAISGASHSITVGSNGLVTGVLTCAGGGGGDGPGGPR